jgi:hypothetical protein
VIDEKSILIDDMKYNLRPWADMGGTAINFNQGNGKIIDTIKEIFNDRIEKEKIENQIKKNDINTTPTEKQKQSGNYRKGKIDYKGFSLVIENPKGSVRWGFNEEGKKWINRLTAHYGYIAGTEGVDCDAIDCFIGPEYNKSTIFVVNQGKDEVFDEIKVIFGVSNIDEAKKLYLSNYKPGWEKNIISIKQTNTKKFREWLKNNNGTKELF